MKVLSLNGLSSLFSVSNSLEVFRLCCMQPGQVQTKSSCLQASIIETSQNDRSQRKSNVAELKVGLFICIAQWGQVLSCNQNIIALQFHIRGIFLNLESLIVQTNKNFLFLLQQKQQRIPYNILMAPQSTLYCLEISDVFQWKSANQIKAKQNIFFNLSV